jgi:hypothetical protein
MDAAPLVSGHAHARKAVAELQKGSSQAAEAEHELAAGEFASARRGTEDLEVLFTVLVPSNLALNLLCRLSAS